MFPCLLERHLCQPQAVSLDIDGPPSALNISAWVTVFYRCSNEAINYMISVSSSVMIAASPVMMSSAAMMSPPFPSWLCIAVVNNSELSEDYTLQFD